MSDVMTQAVRIDRRRFLVTGVGVAGGAALVAGGMSGTAAAAPAPAVPAAPAAKEWQGRTSANGWPIVGTAPSHRVEGAGGVHFTALDGDVATVLTHVVRRYHYEIHTLGAGEVTGHTGARAVAAPYESNCLSGTALAIRPLLYPVRARDGFFPQELVVVRDILAELEGVVKWGGDESTPKESHFQIDVRPGDSGLRRVAAKLRGWDEMPGSGAGTIDVLAPGRVRAAKALAARQR
ncbi:hypothetical protein [Streptomyces sp. BPTC-684]|uniref:hypothetical protein n=1 Tax=Streptomyces sp. BPTC-684 TaxID=3043734 RepID=UPI0024B18029|nr:hypothetical protein [Streptomyces sp. BPTC-684]WHM36919.1 hypothetical protein QIY60_08465 [Streptomyces sp. BPTC-684]